MLKDSCHLSHCVRLWMLCATNVSRFNSNCIVRQDCAKPNTPAWSDSLRLTPVCWAPAHGLSCLRQSFSSYPQTILEPSESHSGNHQQTSSSYRFGILSRALEIIRANGKARGRKQHNHGSLRDRALLLFPNLFLNQPRQLIFFTMF